MGFIYDTTVVDWDKEEKYINYKRIEHVLNSEDDDENIAALITLDEADGFLQNLLTSTPYKSYVDTLFGIGDVASSYSGSIYEGYRVGRIINEFRSFNIEAQEYVGKNGNVYIRISGHAGVRAYLNATRYLANNPRIVYMGIGTHGLNSIAVGASRFAIIFSAAYRAVELICRDEYTLVNFFVNLTMDMAKVIVSAQISTAVVSALGLTTASGIFVGGSVVAVAIGIFAIGLVVAGILYWLDTQFGISEAIIKDLKFHRRVKAPTISPQPVFNNWKAMSRG